MKLIASCMGICLSAGITVAAAKNSTTDQPPSHYGFTLAVPQAPFSLPPLQDWAKTARGFVSAILTIDSTGKPIAIKAVKAADSTIVQHAESTMTAWQFSPAYIRSIPTESQLPCLVHPLFTTRSISVVFPVDDQLTIHSLRFYERTLLLNGIKPPRIDSFPAYFCDLSPGDTMTVYPLALFKLGLDRAGGPVIIETVLSTAGPFTDQLWAAANWGSYRPLKIQSKSLASPAFLLISLYPEIGYPSPKFSARSSTVPSAQENWRLRLLLDTLGGVMAPPVPRTNGEIVVTGVDPLATTFDSLIVRLQIDTSGNVRAGRVSSSSQLARKLCVEAAQSLRFYPALDFSGKPVPFGGIALFDFSSSTIVRIQIDWL